jgi:hypothetical protein
VDKRDLSDEPLPVVSLVKTTKLPDKEEIVEVLMEDTSLWLVTHSAQSKQSKIVDLRGH